MGLQLRSQGTSVDVPPQGVALVEMVEMVEQVDMVGPPRGPTISTISTISTNAKPSAPDRRPTAAPVRRPFRSRLPWGPQLRPPDRRPRPPPVPLAFPHGDLD